MATLASVLTYSRAQIQVDSNGLTDTNGVLFANEALMDFRRRLVAGGVDAGTITEFAQTGTAGTGKYSYPTNPSVLWLKTMELNYSSTTPADYKVATQIDVSNIPGNKSTGWLRTNASTQNPYFDDRGDSYEIFPTPTAAHNLTSLINMFYFAKPAEYTATTDVIAYPESIDYRILGWRIAASYLYSIGATTGSARNVHLLGDSFNAKYDERVKQIIATLSRGSQQPIQATPIQLTGFEF